jgi:hypothetical protein
MTLLHSNSIEMKEPQQSGVRRSQLIMNKLKNKKH